MQMAFFLFIFILIIFLFVGGESRQHHRLIKDIWDAGHLVLFAALIYSYFSHYAKASSSIIKKLLFTSLFCLLIGTAIEVIQIFIHRDFSTDDIINDLIGGYIGFLGLIIFGHQVALKKRIIALAIAIVLIIIGLRQLEKDVLDEIKMQQAFPVIADFEIASEMSRLESKNVIIKRVKQHSYQGQHSLKIDYLPGRYPAVTIEHLKGNWSGFKTLAFYVYNPGSKPVSFELKIYDQKHALTGRSYNDRFNKEIVFTSGWNSVEIPLNEIIEAPKRRSMDTHKLKAISLFTDKQQQPVTLYLDYIHLK
ncbi:MAG: VanZ family protein [Gammaproteobacteria bacterium]|nr:VanZ family protein [Gammaproteobacteria bacterium]